MTEEIRRRKTTDPEMDAMHVLTQAFADLDITTINRILVWAKERFVEAPKNGAIEVWGDVLDGQIKIMQRRAEDLGVDDRTLMHTVAHVRSKQKLAPVDNDSDVEATDADVAKRVAS